MNAKTTKTEKKDDGHGAQVARTGKMEEGYWIGRDVTMMRTVESR